MHSTLKTHTFYDYYVLLCLIKIYNKFIVLTKPLVVLNGITTYTTRLAWQ